MRALVVIGTRPEAIKLGPVVAALRARADTEVRVCVTGQHREMVDPLLALFDLRPDHDLDLMRPNQDLATLTANALVGVTAVLDETRPDWVVVQGDTTTALAAGLAGFYRGVRVAHVEAGLRTHDLRHPFPEEMNRRVVDLVSAVHFAPTERARANLLRDGTDPERIHVTGNTVIDALHHVLRRTDALPVDVPDGARVVLVTAHRRESFGAGLAAICDALRSIADEFADVQIVYPVHLNPNVRVPVAERLGGHARITLLAPLEYASLVRLMWRSTLILTDSGGIQEEAPSLGKPVLVLRDTTERPEAVEAGCARLVGTDAERIVSEARRLLTDRSEYERMARVANPFGDGHASERIASALGAMSATGSAAASPTPTNRAQATDAAIASLNEVRASAPNVAANLVVGSR